MFFWKLLAGIRGTLTDGFLEESIVIQQLCVCISQEHMDMNMAQMTLCSFQVCVAHLKDYREKNTFSLFHLPHLQRADS